MHNYAFAKFVGNAGWVQRCAALYILMFAQVDCRQDPITWSLG
jgi:hypothetical protein